MASWKIAGVQMDCQLGRTEVNLDAVRTKLVIAADAGAKLVVFPECVLTGYGFISRDEASRCAEPIPGPSSDLIAADCA